MRTHSGKLRHRLRMTAFTLVEILIVVVILGILAAIVVPQFSDASADTTAATLRTTLASVRTQVDLQYYRSMPFTYPATIDNAWFAGGAGPQHPDNTMGVATWEVDSTAGRTHPPSKVLKAGVAGAFWYNPTNGLVRARVADQGTSASTLTFYNLVNDSSEVALGNYGGGGGWS